MHQVRKENNIRWRRHEGIARRETIFCIVRKRVLIMRRNIWSIFFLRSNNKLRIKKWRESRKIFYPIWRWPLRGSHLGRVGSSSSEEGSRANFISLHRMASTRSGNEWFVGERERERAGITIFTRLPSRSQCHGPMEPPGNADDPTTREPRGMSVSGPRSTPRRQRNQFAVTCRTTTVFWNNINSLLRDIGPPLGNENSRLSVNGNSARSEPLLCTGYVRLRDESGTTSVTFADR